MYPGQGHQSYYAHSTTSPHSPLSKDMTGNSVGMAPSHTMSDVSEAPGYNGLGSGNNRAELG